MLKHAPAPWERFNLTIADAYSFEVATVADDRDKSFESTAIADANLIAAAPELLAACEQFMLADNYGQYGGGSMRHAYKMAEAAIAKAKGVTC